LIAERQLMNMRACEWVLLVPPEIDGSETIEELSVVVGGSVTFNCPATGVPRPSIRWTRLDETFSINSLPNVQLHEAGHQLELFNAQIIDMGQYACSASNLAGNVSKKFLLDVHGMVDCLF
jgi:hemicentin